MAGDWIKMRGNLWDDPRVSKLCDITGQGEAAIVGALYWLWATADQHTEDGCMPGLTLRQIDRKTGVQGFAAALCEIGWLVDDPQGVVIVKFEEHNGTSAKRRCTEAQRKANSRTVSASDADNSQTDHGQIPPSCGAREEKRREELTEPSGSVKAAKAPSTRGQRLPKDWLLPKPWGDWALTQYPHWTPDVVRLIGQTFGNHWKAKSGKDATKLDWEGTWQNWVTSDITQRAHPPPKATTETAYQRSMREKYEQVAPSIAASRPGGAVALNPMEVLDGLTRIPG